jgi:hypothetical protein
MDKIKLIYTNKWVIMDKERTVIAKGVPRQRYLIPLNDMNDNKRIMYYSSKGRARAGFTGSGFYRPDYNKKYQLEPVKVKITIEEV